MLVTVVSVLSTDMQDLPQELPERVQTAAAHDQSR